MRANLKIILLIIALIFLLFATAGLTEWGVGSIHFQTGWVGMFFFVASFLA